MTYRQLTRKLRALGCRFDRQARGSHEIWINPENRGKATIPFWGSDDLKPGVIGSILRDLGIARRDFDQA